ncbi:MAG: hypothetical protein HY658_00860 [Actinobacteria bacterium]|nr:hypothetical protein [Actinomycetota bacterium]
MTTPKSSRRLLALSVSAALLSGCTAVSPQPPPDSESSGASPSSSVSPSPSPSPSPTVEPLDDDEYQEELDQASAAVADSVARVAGATSYAALVRQVLRARGVVERQAGRLGRLVAPVDVAESHGELVGALRRFASSFLKTAQEVDDHKLCAAPSVMSRLGGVPSASALRAAEKALRQAGFDVEKMAPKAVAMAERSLANGTFIVSGLRNGRGRMTIENIRGQDVVITFSLDGKTPTISVYVTGGTNFTISGFRDGSYWIYAARGVDWSGELGTFTRRCEFAKFETPFSFSTRYTSTYVEYTTGTLRFGGEPFGEDSTGAQPIDPGEFPG